MNISQSDDVCDVIYLQHFDFHALEETTEYDGGFHDDSPTVK